MKKQSLLFFIFVCTSSLLAMHRNRRTVYVEKAAFTKQYHQGWQRFKHAMTCSCCSGSVCKSATRGAYNGNLRLLIPHLPHNTDNEKGAELFSCMLQGADRSHYCDILKLLMKRGFNPTKSYGDFKPAISSIVGLQSIDLFELATQLPFEDKTQCKKIFNKLYQHIDVRPEEDRFFYYQALTTLAQKNPDTSSQIISARMERRRRISTHRATVDSMLPTDHTPQRITAGKHSVPHA